MKLNELRDNPGARLKFKRFVCARSTSPQAVRRAGNCISNTCDSAAAVESDLAAMAIQPSAV